ncbi:TPM domain-containing protein [Vaginella massiliensis]|uniref:TPM domain-containing protein n=1 Tax=Vaginella massiliensis TaxID=1816680 RepID=UPI000838D184|nr:TPM domain-containing protein [Vaginella massiliensis]
MDEQSPRFFNKKQEKKIIKAIIKAEKKTSGEIRIHVESQPSDDHIQRSIQVFKDLGMQNTKHRNGVLFHISPADHNFTIIGDEGINAVTPENFWEEIKSVVIAHYQQQQYTKGTIEGIKMTGKALKKYFPHEEHDENELPNEISQN